MELVRILHSFWLLKCHTFRRPTLASTQGRAVLKITITDSSDEQRWSLQGQLVGQWAAELKSSWREAHRTEETRRCVVELTEVTSIDRNGEAVLAEIMSQGAEFIASDVYTKHLLRKATRHSPGNVPATGLFIFRLLLHMRQRNLRK
jgi:ABC-type transporter Mla MlaB component